MFLVDVAKDFPLRRFTTTLPKSAVDKAKVVSVGFVDPVPDKFKLQKEAIQFPNPLVITANGDESATVWDLYTMKHLCTLKEDQDIAKQPTGSTHDSKKDKEPVPRKLTSVATYATMSKDAKGLFKQEIYIVAGREDGSGVIWKLSNKSDLPPPNQPLQPIQYLCGLINVEKKQSIHSKSISCVTICDPKPKPPIVVMAGTFEKNISIWDLKTGTFIYHIQTKHTDLLLSLTCLHMGEESGYEGVKIVTTGWDKNIFTFSWGSALHDHHLLGHTKSVTCCASYVTHLPDTMDECGHRVLNKKKCAIVVTGSLDKTAIIWDLESGTKVNTLIGHKEKLTAIQICDNRNIDDDVTEEEDHINHNSKDNNTNHLTATTTTPVVITSSEDKTVIIWDLITTNKIRIIEETNKILSIAIYAVDFKFIVMGGMDDGTTKVWNLSNTQRIWKMSTAAVTAIATYDPRPGETFFTESIIVIGTIDKTLSIFPVAKRRAIAAAAKEGSESEVEEGDNDCLGKLEGHHTMRINGAVIYSPQDDITAPPLVIAGDGAGWIIVWNLATRVPIFILKGAHDKLVLTVAIYHPPYHHNDSITSDDENNIPFDIHSKRLDLSKPMLLSGGGDNRVVAWDILQPKRYNETMKSNEPIVLDYNITLDDNGTPLSRTQQEQEHMKNAILLKETKPKESKLLKEKELQANKEKEREKEKGTNNAIALKSATEKPISTKDITPTIVVPKEKKIDHTNFVRSISVYHPAIGSKESSTFVTTSYDCTAIVWDLATFTALRQLSGVHKQYVFFSAIYDPQAHLGILSDKLEDNEENQDRLHPTVITTSYDNTTSIWNMTTGKLKRKLIGHDESVTALALYVPQSAKEDPLVITGSIDQLVMIWNLFTGERLQLLVGHTDRVCYITVYLPPLLSSSASSDSMKYGEPLLISGSDDKTTIVWEDALYQKSFMPITDAVQRAFISDCSGEDWPMITNLAVRFDISLFYENGHLFYLAIKEKRNDFLLKFATYLKPLLRNIIQTKTQNLLTYAIQKNDLVSTRCILLAWIENLNEDINDMLTQRLYHAMYYFPYDSLRELVNKYPTEFLYFISSLGLVRNHPSLMGDGKEKVELLCLHGDERYEVQGTLDPLGNYYDIWKNHTVHFFNRLEKNIIKYTTAHITTSHTVGTATHSSLLVRGISQGNLSKPMTVSIEIIQEDIKLNTPQQELVSLLTPYTHSLPPDTKQKKLTLREHISRLYTRFVRSLMSSNQHPQPVTSLAIPLQNIAKVDESLVLFLEVSNQLNRVDIFDSEIVIIALRYFWDNYGKEAHLIAVLRYVILLFLFDFALYYYEITYANQPWRDLISANNGTLPENTNPNWGVIWFDDNTEGQHLNSSLNYNHTGFVIFNYIVLGYFIYYFIEECIQVTRELHHYEAAVKSKPLHRTPSSTTPSAPTATTSATSSTASTFTSSIDKVFNWLKVIVQHVLGDIWNFIDISLVVTGTVGMVCRIYYDEDSPTGRCFLALCSILLWFKLLYYLRPFSNSGPLGKPFPLFIHSPNHLLLYVSGYGHYDYL